MKPKIYVGVIPRDHGRDRVFKAEDTPSREVYGDRFGAVIGPFKTMAGARFMALYGRNNPHCQHVNDAERLARIINK